MTTKRVLGLVLSVLGIVLALFALIYGNLRDTEEKITATASAAESVFVYTETGVLDLVEPKVTVELKASEGKVFWGLAKTQDALDYVGKSSATKISGLKDWNTLAVSPVAGEEAAAKADADALKAGSLNFAAAPIWEETGEGEGTATVELDLDPELARSLVATSSTGVAPEISLTWIKSTGDFPLLRYLMIGLVVALIGLYLLFNEGLAQNRVDYFRKREAQKQEQRDAFASAETSVLPVFEGDLADPELDRDVQKQHTDAAFGAAILPGTSRTLGLRERELPESERIILGDLTAAESEADLEAQEVSDSDAMADADTVSFEIEDVVNASEHEVGAEEATADFELQDDGVDTQDDAAQADVVAAAADSDVKRDWKALWDFDAESEQDSKEGAQDA